MTVTVFDNHPASIGVADALVEIVEDSFARGLGENREQWVEANPAIAARLYRFHHAMVWHWADGIIQTEGLSDPPPNEFMTLFREAAFSRLQRLLPGLSASGLDMLWGMLQADAAMTPEVVQKILERRPPIASYALLRDWMANQGVDLRPSENETVWMLTSNTVPMPDTVRAALKDVV